MATLIFLLALGFFIEIGGYGIHIQDGAFILFGIVGTVATIINVITQRDEFINRLTALTMIVVFIISLYKLTILYFF